MTQYCLEAGCAQVVSQGRCATHTQRREQQRGNWDVRRWYRTARWRRLRAMVLAAEPLCWVCLREGQTRPATEVDHVVRHGGDEMRFWARANLQALCQVHHAAKTQRGE